MSLSASAARVIMKEFRDLSQAPPDGMRVFLNEDCLTSCEAVIDGPEDTPFEGGSFRVRLEFESDYPATPPKGYFLTKIFHPNVSSKGNICVNTLKKDWKSDLGIKHVLITIRCLLIYPNAESALNEEAGKLLLEKYDDYFKHAKLMTSIHAKREKTAAAASSGAATSASASSASSTASASSASSSASASSSSASSSSSSSVASTSSSSAAANASAPGSVFGKADRDPDADAENDRVNVGAKKKPVVEKKKSLKRL